MNKNLIIKSIKLEPNDSDYGKRLDLYLSKSISDISRSRLKELIKHIVFLNRSSKACIQKPRFIPCVFKLNNYIIPLPTL